MCESRSCAALVLADDRDRGHAIDAVLLRLVRLEDEVHFLDRDLVRQRRQLVENLLRLQAGFAAERLREEHQTNRSQSCRRKSSRSRCLIGWRDRAMRPNLSNLEEVVERLACALLVAGLCCAARAGLALDRRPRREERARLRLVLRRHTRRQRRCVHSQRALVSNDTH